MDKTMRAFDGNKGLTLVELMVAMAVFLILIGLMYPTFSTMKEQTVFIENMEALHERAQRMINYMAEDIRMAGFVVGPKDNIAYCPGDGLKTVLDHTDGNPYDTINFITAEPVKIRNDATCMSGMNTYRVLVANNASIGDNTITLNYDLTRQSSTGADCVRFIKATTDINNNAQSLLAFETASYVNNLYTISNINNTQITLYDSLNIAVSSGSPLFIVKRYSYTVNPGERSLRRRYWVSGQGDCQPQGILIDEASGDSGGIDAMQFQYLYYDPVTDSIVTADTPPSDLSKLRAVKIWLLVRSETLDRGYTDTNIYSIANADINGGNPFNDHYRRITMTKIVEVNSIAK